MVTNGIGRWFWTNRSILANVLYLAYRAARVVEPRSCMTGTCWCRGAEDCFFKRCKNCDAPLDRAGKPLDDPSCPYLGDDPDHCPDCGVAMRRG